MSRESMEWLNTMVLIGGVASRNEKAWHYLESAQGAEPNHYDGSIPVEDLRRRLFGWTPESYPVTVTLPDGSQIVDFDRQAIVRPEFNGLPAGIMGIHSKSYDHQDGFGPMVDHAKHIIDDDVEILSAGLLKNGATAWIQVGKAGGASVAGGDKVIPFITFTNSLDGTIANRIDTGAIRVVCDNTLAAHLGSNTGKGYRVKHTKNSRIRLADARDVLGLLNEVEADFTAEVNALLEIEVNNLKFEKIVDHLVPLIDSNISKAGATRSEKKRDALWGIWNKGDMVSTLDDTAYKAWQAFNTFETHFSQTRGNSRGEKNFTTMATGKFIDNDQNVVAQIRSALKLAA